MAVMCVGCEMGWFSVQELVQDCCNDDSVFLVLTHSKFSNDCHPQVGASIAAFKVTLKSGLPDFMHVHNLNRSSVFKNPCKILLKLYLCNLYV